MSAKKHKNSLGNIPQPVRPKLSTAPIKTIKNSELEKITEQVLKKTPKQGQDQDKKQGNDKDQDKEEEEEEVQGMNQDQEQD